MVWPIRLWGQDDFVKSVHLRHIHWKIDICVCADCGGTWQVLERVIISLGDKLYRLSLAQLLCVNKSWHWEQMLVVFCPEVEKIQFWNTGGILYCIPEHRSCHRIISVWETCICQEFRVCSFLLLNLELGTSASKQALHLLKICINTWWGSCLEILAVSLWIMFIINAKEPCQNVFCYCMTDCLMLFTFFKHFSMYISCPWPADIQSWQSAERGTEYVAWCQGENILFCSHHILK